VSTTPTTTERVPVVMFQAEGASMSSPAVPPPPHEFTPVLKSPQRLVKSESFGSTFVRSTQFGSTYSTSGSWESCVRSWAVLNRRERFVRGCDRRDPCPLLGGLRRRSSADEHFARHRLTTVDENNLSRRGSPLGTQGAHDHDGDACNGKQKDTTMRPGR
jgi:hypothetical protein